LIVGSFFPELAAIVTAKYNGFASVTAAIKRLSLEAA
jgi:hypothetical protein